ncbi:TetR/AcrR family transcriptional regulator [Acrocarpospora macrocephala]|uniref:TetR family transcriptional regulator n=1 Tax=Acrocarpospora macrocephala TaxID=150177 RepID=A0A5M3X1V4_9ACTN|nr:TetR/AcrR family transcriptional regulator [Acrocarpospora macrocephala]GES15695.1 TetR family transcriptional regulator [Acrocarpospora macrocephala]
MADRGLRADAARNRTNIVHAARALIAAHGVDVGMDDIAREAGVAVGTLYRHFPAKADLIAAIVGERIEEMLADLDAVSARLDAGGSARDELVALVTTVAARAGEDRLLKAAAGDLVRTSLNDVEHRAVAALRQIVAAGHRQKALYRDVSADDVALILTLLPGEETPDPARRRWVQLVLRSLLADDAGEPP